LKFTRKNATKAIYARPVVRALTDANLVTYAGTENLYARFFSHFVVRNITWRALRKSIFPQAEKDIALGRAIRNSAFAPVAFLFRQSKSLYRLGGKSLLPPQKRLLPLVAFLLSLTR